MAAESRMACDGTPFCDNYGAVEGRHQFIGCGRCKILPEMRIARDGKAYTEEEFYKWYGVTGSNIWDSAIPESSLAADSALTPALYPACAPYSALELGTAPASAQAVTVQRTPTADQVASVSLIMCEYRNGNWLDEHEMWRRDCALERLESAWHRCEVTEAVMSGDNFIRNIICLLGLHRDEGRGMWRKRKHWQHGDCGQSCGCCRAHNIEDYVSGCEACRLMWDLMIINRQWRNLTMEFDGITLL